MVQDLMMRADVTHDGHAVGYQENGWFALPDDEVQQIVGSGNKVIDEAKRHANKGGGYVVTFTGSVGGTADAPQKVEGMDARGLAAYLRAAMHFGDELVKWAEKDATQGKKVGWDHAKAKK